MVPRVNIKWCHVSSKSLVKKSIFVGYILLSNIWPLIKRYRSKIPVKGTMLWLGKKNHFNHYELVKIDLFEKTRGFLLCLSLWGSFLTKNPVWKPWNSNSDLILWFFKKIQKNNNFTCKLTLLLTPITRNFNSTTQNINKEISSK